LRIIKKLYSIKLLSLKGIYQLLASGVSEGSNLMTLFKYAAKMFPDNVAIADGGGAISYKELYFQSCNLAHRLQNDYHINAGAKVALACRNHSEMVKSLIALSRLGADVYLLSADISASQFRCLRKRYEFSLLICDPENKSVLYSDDYSNSILLSLNISNANIASINELCTTKIAQRLKIKRVSKGKVIVLTGGTSGKLKVVERAPSILVFIKPFLALLKQLHLDKYNSVYISTPLSHGFGLAAYLVSVVLGAKVVLTPKFESKNLAALVEKQQVKVLVLVPSILRNLLEHAKLKPGSIECILSGAAPLNPILVQRTFRQYGPILSNLYGTSEAGFSIIATPVDLKRNPESIGKKIPGIKLKVRNQQGTELPSGQIGELCIKCKWSMTNRVPPSQALEINASSSWINTGDLGYVDEYGFYFLSGRTDDMIISGGINVYPIELENILIRHNDISDVAVVGVKDERFGQRLKAYVVSQTLDKPSYAELQHWLRERTARHQRPLSIEFLESIPLTYLGKVDKRLLVSE